ncbi:ammonium transporter [Verrucomicrobiales bacterium]|jgi:ammonium transporter, Amt family|nr:ammonium transporter [Verrucomicrobiales bacterium]MDA7926530.1 ammonium transporter [Verrucomicrobiales bacterium]MDB4359064.1 ammonium transporter [Verrucomicrobiales bacterium]
MRNTFTLKLLLLATFLVTPLLFGTAIAQEAAAPEPGPVDEYLELVEASGGAELAPAFDFFTVSMLWTVIAAAMVFIMHLGFATLEAGLTQAKNTVNILFKNVWIISIGLLTYALLGFNTHYPVDSWQIPGWLGINGPIGDLGGGENDTWAYGGLSLAMTAYGDFIFQAMFAATAATIVSGAVAERMKLGSFMVFSTILVAFGYTIAGSWHWGGGWLSDLGGGDAAFYDFAGSTVVHGFGGAAALACVIILGARKGKYTKDGIKPILGHSMPLAAVGVFLLFFGWFGFNGGSVLSANPGPLGLVFTTTALAAAAGGVASIFISMIVLKKPDLSMALNGLLAGLVSITAGADSVTPLSAIIMGAVGGVIVVFSILFFDKIKIDDPVGAISVHGVCGIWGTLAVAIFGGANFMSQLIGVVAVYAFAFIFSFAVFYIIKLVMGVRVSEEEEAEGLDVAEHGCPAYNNLH